MNRKLLFWCLISISFCLLAFVNVSAQTDWFFVALTSSGDVVYIDKNFTRRRSGITRVWQQTVTSDDNYTISLTEWNCAEKSFRFVQSAVYENNVIVDQSDKKTNWRHFVPDSTGMLLYSNICSPKPKREIQTTDNLYPVNKENGKKSFLQITAKKSALMNEADFDSRIIRKVWRGERFALTGDEPIGAYYRVRDPKTGLQGWLNANHCKIVKEVKPPKKRRGK